LDESKRTRWDTLLKLAQWVHNTSEHSALKMSPYECVTGMKPRVSRMWLPTEQEAIDETDLQNYFGIRLEKLHSLREKTIEALEQRQKSFLAVQAKKNPPRTFKVGQKVLIRKHKSGRFEPKFYGPFIVTKVISESALQVQDPVSEKTDSVHTNYVKPFYSRDRSPATVPLDFQTEDDELRDVEIIPSVEYFPPDGSETHEVVLEVDDYGTDENEVAESQDSDKRHPQTGGSSSVASDPHTAQVAAPAPVTPGQFARSAAKTISQGVTSFAKSLAERFTGSKNTQPVPSTSSSADQAKLEKTTPVARPTTRSQTAVQSAGPHIAPTAPQRPRSAVDVQYTNPPGVKFPTNTPAGIGLRRHRRNPDEITRDEADKYFAKQGGPTPHRARTVKKKTTFSSNLPTKRDSTVHPSKVPPARKKFPSAPAINPLAASSPHPPDADDGL
jgi:hypothetical protein